MLFFSLYFTGCPPLVYSAIEYGGKFDMVAKKMRVMISPGAGVKVSVKLITPRAFTHITVRYYQH
jgi:hypothetical protein